MHGDSLALPGNPPLVRYGLPIYEQGTSPTAGNPFAPTLDGSWFYRLISVSCRLVTSADAGDRTVLVEYLDNQSNRYMLSGAPVTQDPDTTTDWTFDIWQGQAEWEIDGTVVVPLKPLILLPSHTWRIFVDAIDNTDALSRIRYVYEKLYTTDQPQVAAGVGLDAYQQA